MRKVLVVMPMHSRMIDFASAQSMYYASARDDLTVHRQFSVYSALTANFNSLLCSAINNEYDLFAMLHGDMIVDNFWLDVLVEEMDKHDAGVVSVVTSIKTFERETSTALACVGDDRFGIRGRLSHEEVTRLPETFCAEDVAREFPDAAKGEPILLVNTGCFVGDIKRALSRRPNGEMFCFHIGNRIVEQDGRVQQHFEPEDWRMSRELAADGVRVYATSKVNSYHVGPNLFGLHRDKPAGVILPQEVET